MQVGMKQFLIHGLTGVAALVWLIGLGLACRTDGGMLIVLVGGVYLAVRFAHSVLQGRFRDEVRAAYPNRWFRHYLLMFGYTLFAFPGLMSLCGKWPMRNEYALYSTAAVANENWSLALVVALLLPAFMLVVWSQGTRAELQQ